jgi:ribosome-associated protein YbcJ (S4-like RNA binding protein)
MPRFPNERTYNSRTQSPHQDHVRSPREHPASDERESFSPSIRYPELDSYSQERMFYGSERNRYQLRQSELYTMAEAGKFRAISLDDLEKYLYSGDRDRMHRELANLQKDGLVHQKSSRYPKTIRVVTLTRDGQKFMRQTFNDSPQEFYSGIKKVRELHHDTALYEMYQAKGREIEDSGGRIKRVILDYELKRNINRELQRQKHLDPSEQARIKEELSQKHAVPLVNGNFVVPDLRVEYEDSDGNESRVDLEYLTETYRQGDISAKAQAGFALYASHDQAARLHRVLDQHQIMSEILSL